MPASEVAPVHQTGFLIATGTRPADARTVSSAPHSGRLNQSDGFEIFSAKQYTV